MHINHLVRHLAVAAITVSLLAGCGAAEVSSPAGASPEAPTLTAAPTPTPAPTATPGVSPTAAPTEVPSALPTAAPTPTPAVPKADPAIGLRIEAPYKLTELDAVTTAMVDAGFEASLGSLASIVEIGTRQVTRKGVAVGFVMLVRLPGMPEASTTALVNGAASGLTGKVTKLRIAGHDVRIGTNSGQWAAVTSYDGGLLMAFAATKKSVTDVMTALLRAAR
jgi:hypothetical protein